MAQGLYAQWVAGSVSGVNWILTSRIFWLRWTSTGWSLGYDSSLQGQPSRESHHGAAMLVQESRADPTGGMGLETANPAER